MLASGADVEIGGIQFNLSSDLDSYIHIKENLFPDSSAISGFDGKQSADTNLLFWGYDNWINGDGLRYFDEQQPFKWWQGNANPRIPGSIQSPPTRNQASQTTTLTPVFGGFVDVAGTLWYFTGEEGFYSTDQGATWTENTDVQTELETDLDASSQITAVCSDGEFAYFAARDAAGTERGIFRCDSTTVCTNVVTVHASAAAYRGLAVRDGFLYAWTGGALMRYKLDQAGGTLPIAHSTSHRKYRVNNETPTGTVFADVKSDDQTTIMMRSYAGHSAFHEWKIDPQTNKLGGRKFWTLLDGFTAKAFCIHAGIVFALGDYQDKVGLWGYNLQSRQPFFLGYIGEANSVANVRFIAPSYGAQVLIGVDDGTTSYVYVYDAAEDGFSQLDERTIAADGTLIAGVTSRRRRIAAAFATTTTKFNRWNLDTDTPAGSWDWDSAAHDFDYPYEEKVLLGFHVNQDPTIATGTINVDYQLNEDGSWIDAGTSTAAQPHTYLPVSTSSSTRKFRTLRIRMNGANGCRGFSIVARAYVNSRRETWRLKLDLSKSIGLPAGKSRDADTLRNALHAMIDNGNVVAFKDGRRYKKQSDTADQGFVSNDVIVTFPQDYADSQVEGICEVILRSVEPSA